MRRPYRLSLLTWTIEYAKPSCQLIKVPLCVSCVIILFLDFSGKEDGLTGRCMLILCLKADSYIR